MHDGVDPVFRGMAHHPLQGQVHRDVGLGDDVVVVVRQRLAQEDAGIVGIEPERLADRPFRQAEGGEVVPVRYLLVVADIDRPLGLVQQNDLPRAGTRVEEALRQQGDVLGPLIGAERRDVARHRHHRGGLPVPTVRTGRPASARAGSAGHTRSRTVASSCSLAGL